jgi:hypothetical protein
MKTFAEIKLRFNIILACTVKYKYEVMHGPEHIFSVKKYKKRCFGRGYQFVEEIPFSWELDTLLYIQAERVKILSSLENKYKCRKIVSERKVKYLD